MYGMLSEKNAEHDCIPKKQAYRVTYKNTFLQKARIGNTISQYLWIYYILIYICVTLQCQNTTHNLHSRDYVINFQ
jgi:hypothetical protein